LRTASPQVRKPCHILHGDVLFFVSQTCSFNKTRDDFDTKEAWDDYLEQMEDISE
jgi:hypothetical protein